MTTNQNKPNRPTWIDSLCEALAQAFEDESLSKDAHNRLADAMEGVVNLYPVKRDANEARTLLPIALERAINSTKDEDQDEESEHDDSEKPLHILAQELAEPLEAFLDHSRVPESISGRITDALLELADIRRPGSSNGGLAIDALIDLAAHPSN